MGKDMFPDTEPLLVRDEPWMRVKIGPQAGPVAEPTSPSVILSEEFAAKARAIALDPIWNRQLSEIENLRKLCARHEADTERLALENRELKEELIRRNQDIEDYKLRTKNLSRKIVEDRRTFPRGVHGS